MFFLLRSLYLTILRIKLNLKTKSVSTIICNYRVIEGILNFKINVVVPGDVMNLHPIWLSIVGVFTIIIET
jgi:hypothetical protein